MCDITLGAARYLARYASERWSEVCNNEKRKVVVFRPSNTSCAVRRVVVHYRSGVIHAILNDEKDKSSVVKCTKATTVVLGRLFERPSMYRVLGFRAVGSCCACSKEKPEKTEKAEKKDSSDEKKKCCAACKKSKPKADTKCETKCARVCKAADDDVQDELEGLKKKVKALKEAQKKLMDRVDKKGEKAVQKEDDSDGDGNGDDEWTPKLRSYVSKQVRSELSELRMDKLECLQLLPDGCGFVYSEKDGEVYWSSEINAEAGDSFERGTKKDRPQALCVGTHGRYFVRFSGGDAECNGPAEVMGMVKFGNIRMVAYGGEADSYVVVFENGNVVWNNIAASLVRLLCKCVADGVGVDYVSMGGSGEYFVRYGNKAQYGNLCETATKALDECPGRIMEVTFGAGDALLARYQVKK